MKDIIIDGQAREWTITVNLQKIVDYVNAQTIIDYKRNNSGEMTNEHIYTDVDKDFILSAMGGAFANVSNVLARRMPSPASLDENKENMIYVLVVGENHDDSMANILYIRIMDYLCRYALSVWRDQAPEKLDFMLDEIRSAIHYRKHSVAHHRKCKLHV